MSAGACARAGLAAALLAAAGAAAAQTETGLVAGRGTRSQETDILRLVHRRALSSADVAPQPWWRPAQLQLGASVWRVPDVRGITRRYDLNATPVWRGERALGGALRGYVEGGIGVYLLSHTVNNETDRLPSSLQFGSHVGAGLRVGPRGQGTIGVGLQHLSNAGLKQPNRGINFYLLTASLRL